MMITCVCGLHVELTEPTGTCPTAYGGCGAVLTLPAPQLERLEAAVRKSEGSRRAKAIESAPKGCQVCGNRDIPFLLNPRPQKPGSLSVCTGCWEQTYGEEFPTPSRENTEAA
jgi:hypothetical protein